MGAIKEIPGINSLNRLKLLECVGSLIWVGGWGWEERGRDSFRVILRDSSGGGKIEGGRFQFRWKLRLSSIANFVVCFK